MERQRRPLSWKARHVGNRYCAPACGRGCTWAEYQQARKHAAALVRALGPGWKPNIWENMGWYYEAVTTDGTMRVRENRSRDDLLISYSAYLRKANATNSIVGNWSGCGSTPQKAIAAAIRDAEAEAVLIQETLASYRAATRAKRRRD